MNQHRIDICVTTYRRPHLLSRLMECLTDQSWEDVIVRLIVIDNDPEGSGRGVVNKFRECHLVDVIYDIEANRGIARARNRALLHACADFIAFLDDDELVSSGWLKNMWIALHRFNADAVFGPVVRRLPANAPLWAVGHPSFTRPRRLTGSAATFSSGPRRLAIHDSCLILHLISQVAKTRNSFTNCTWLEDA